jgi:carbonic anhydrase
MANADEAELHQTILDEHGVDTRSVEFRTVKNQLAALEQDVIRIRTYPLLASGVTVGGAIYDVKSGKLIPQNI